MPINRGFLWFGREMDAGGVSALVVTPVRSIEDGTNSEPVERLNPIPGCLLLPPAGIGGAKSSTRVLGELPRIHDSVKPLPVIIVHKAMVWTPLQLFGYKLDQAQGLLEERAKIEDGQAPEWRGVRGGGFWPQWTGTGSRFYRL